MHKTVLLKIFKSRPVTHAVSMQAVSHWHPQWNLM